MLSSSMNQFRLLMVLYNTTDVIKQAIQMRLRFHGLFLRMVGDMLDVSHYDNEVDYPYLR